MNFDHWDDPGQPTLLIASVEPVASSDVEKEIAWVRDSTCARQTGARRVYRHAVSVGGTIPLEERLDEKAIIGCVQSTKERLKPNRIILDT